MSQFMYWLVLSGMTIFQYHAALVAMVNEGYSKLFVFFLLSGGATFAIVFVHRVSGLGFVHRRIGIPDFIGNRIQRFKIVKSYRSYREYTMERRNNGIQGRVSEWVVRSIRVHGYLAAFLGSIIPVPLLRMATVVTCRNRLKGGVYVVILASELRILVEIIFYEQIKVYLFLLNRLTVFRFALILIGVVAFTFIIDWVGHARRDNHFSPNRFDPEA